MQRLLELEASLMDMLDTIVFSCSFNLVFSETNFTPCTLVMQVLIFLKTVLIYRLSSQLRIYLYRYSSSDNKIYGCNSLGCKITQILFGIFVARVIIGPYVLACILKTYNFLGFRIRKY